MKRYGQAEYAHYVLRQTLEKLLEDELITEAQFKQLDQKNKQDCFEQFCTALTV